MTMFEIVQDIFKKAREAERNGDFETMRELDRMGYRLIPSVVDEARRAEAQKGIIYKIKNSVIWKKLHSSTPKVKTE